MSKPTREQTHRVHRKIDEFGQVLKHPSDGGPSYAGTQMGRSAMGNVAEDDNDAAQHPTYPDYNMPEQKEEDTHQQFKAALVESGRFGEGKLEQRDIDYVRSKMDAEENATFKLFVERSLPRGTPWAKEFFEKIQPGWYQGKFEIISQKLELIKRYMKLTLEGPQSIEDMYLLYILYSGRIEMPTSITDIIRPESQGRNDSDYTSGLFSPTRWVSDHYRISMRNQNYLANFAIPGIDAKYLGKYGGAAQFLGEHNPLQVETLQKWIGQNRDNSTREIPGLADAGDFLNRRKTQRARFNQ